MPVDDGEWIYAARGITVFVNTDPDRVLHVALYAPTTAVRLRRAPAAAPRQDAAPARGVTPDCPFCAIVEQRDPDAREVFRDEHVVAFFPLNPATRGHTLIVPHEHVPDIFALARGVAATLARATVRLAHAIRDAFTPEGLNVIQSNGSAATQTVPHLHVHLVPRWPDDAMGPIWPSGVTRRRARRRARKAARRV